MVSNSFSTAALALKASGSLASTESVIASRLRRAFSRLTEVSVKMKPSSCMAMPILACGSRWAIDFAMAVVYLEHSSGTGPLGISLLSVILVLLLLAVIGALLQAFVALAGDLGGDFPGRLHGGAFFLFGGLVGLRRAAQAPISGDPDELAILLLGLKLVRRKPELAG